MSRRDRLACASRRPAAVRLAGSAAAIVAVRALLMLATAGGSAAGDDDLSFVRVNLPAAAVREVPREEGRFVPMPLVEFEEAVARLGPARDSLRRPLASTARYDLALDPAGGLSGSLAFTLDSTAAGLPVQLPIGGAGGGRCTLETAEGTGEAVLFGLPDGRVAVRTAGAGTYTTAVRLPATAEQRVTLPLVPALSATVEVALPEGMQPFVVGPAAAAAIVEPAEAAGRWRILVGPVPDLTLVLRDPAAAPLVATWNSVLLRGRQAEVLARCLPATAWPAGRFELESGPGLQVSSVLTAGGAELGWRLENERLVIDIPRSLAGSREGIIVTAAAARPLAGPQAVPTIQPPAGQWAGCGVQVLVDPAFALERLELEECLVVSAAAAGSWPLPEPPAAVQAGLGGAGLQPARLFVEHQAAGGRARVVVGPRAPVLDTARVTTVDISPGTLLGRANCDVRVRSGEAFEIVAEVAPGWFIDAVEPVDWSQQTAGETVVCEAGPLDWRVVRSPRGSELRIDLPLAATPRRSLGLRISGHRAGLPLAAEFSSADLDMIRFPGEPDAAALLEFRVGPMAVVEVAGGAMGLEPATGRLAALAGDTPPRARIRAGERAGSVQARLVQRRPPVEADVRIALVARDDRLAESFTFTCRPVAGELDALAIHFSEPLGDGLEWTLVDPASGTLAARRFTAGGPDGEAAAALGLSGGEADAAFGIAETWLVELRPATTGAVTVRAVRSRPFEAAAPVPLAWVEAAEQPGGVVAVRGGRGRRPELINRRLRELPPAADGEEAAVVELAYGPLPSMRGGDGLAAADLLPPAVVGGARAWAWQEVTRCWCHDSGQLEWEARIDLENQGREEVTITVPAGLAVEGVSVGGTAVVGDLVAAVDGGSLAVPLTARRGRTLVVVRGSGSRPAGLGWWRIGAVSCGIDVPVLEREVHLLLPPGLTVAGAGEAGGDWAARLFAAGPVPSVTTVGGFRDWPITAATRGGISEAVVVRRGLVTSLAIIAGAVAFLLACLIAGRSGLAVVVGCVLAAGGALWFEAPWHAVPRAIWWAGIAGAWVAGCRIQLPAATATGLFVSAVVFGPAALAQDAGADGSLAVPGGKATAAQNPAEPAAAASAEPAAARAPRPLRVFVTPGSNGGTALVPERLFRRLAEDESGGEATPVRVLAAVVIADPGGGSWRIGLDIDADQGGTLLLRQPPGVAAWELGSEPVPPGVSILPTSEASEVRLLATAPGRQRVWLRCLPVAARQGDLDVAEIGLPPAARATLEIGRAGDPERAKAWQCDLASGGGWLPAAGSAAGFDVSGAERVRIVRPADARDRLASELRSAVSFNDIDWLAGRSRLTATFDVGREREIVRSVVVRADPDLEPLPPAAGSRPLPLGDGRWLLSRSQPRAGQARFTIEFSRRLPDAVGVFEVPAAWLEGAGNDVRTVRLRPAAGLEAEVDLPLGMTAVRPRAEDGPATTSVWRCDAVAGGEATAGGLPVRPRISVRRREQKLRGSQDLAVEFAVDQVRLKLDCQLEAATLPLVEVPVDVPPAAVIDRVTVWREVAADDAAPRSEAVDIVWSRVAAERIVVVCQQPDTGRFRLELDARLPIRPAVRGRLPLARIGPPLELPLAVRPRSLPPLAVELGGDGAGPPSERLELAAGEPGPSYRLVEDALPPPAAEPVERPLRAADEAGRAAVELTAVDLAIDPRGRCWGLVRFELVAPQPVITLRMPTGLRLFDVRVDGREAVAMPRGGDAWDLRLHDIAWPRTVVAVIAGTVGPRLDSAGPIRLEPPRIDGLAAGRVTWSLDTPAGFEIRVSEPARVLGDEEWAELVGAERRRHEEAFAAAIATVAERDLGRLQAFAADRRQGTRPTGEQTWYAAWRESHAGEPVQTRLLAGSDGSLTIRAVPGEGRAGGRGLATALLVGLVLAGWRLAVRGPQFWRRLLPVIHRWWWVGSGLAWLVLLEPKLPGWLLLAVGLWLARPILPAWSPPRGPDPDEASGESTRTYAST
jgi:hypothetical protein